MKTNDWYAEVEKMNDQNDIEKLKLDNLTLRSQIAYYEIAIKDAMEYYKNSELFIKPSFLARFKQLIYRSEHG